MSVLEAKAAMRKIGLTAKSVADDSTLSNTEKVTRLEALKAESKGFSEQISLHELAASLLGAETAGPGDELERKAADREREPVGFGAQVTKSQAFTQMKAAVLSRGRVAQTFEIKAAGTITEGTVLANGQLNGMAGVASLPNYLPGIVDLRFAPILVSQAVAQGSTDSPIVSYVREVAETIGAAAVAEGQLKPQADVTVVRVNEQVGKIAVFAKITDETVQDIPQFESFLEQRLLGQVGREEENEVLNGTGYPALAGILGRTGMTAANVIATAIPSNSPATLIDAIFAQITAIRVTAFIEPDTIVVNPSDWQRIRLAKDGQGQYQAGGPFGLVYGQPGPTNLGQLWGLKVIVTPRLAAGTVVVGGFQECAQLFRRQGVTVEMTNSNEDDFKRNLLAIRAESRAALVVYRPAGFGLVTFTWAP